MKATPIPTYVGEYLQIDIFHAGNQIFYSTVDRYSKFTFLRRVENKRNAHQVVSEILQLFPGCRYCMTDNENVFSSFPMQTLLKQKQITQTLTPIRHSISNAQVERIHRTLIELARCLAEQRSEEFENVILDAVDSYNNSIHSVIRAKPIDVFYHQDRFTNIPKLLETAQEKMLQYENQNREQKEYHNGDVIFVKNNRRDKRCAVFTKHIVREDIGPMIITSKNTKVHKDNIRK